MSLNELWEEQRQAHDQVSYDRKSEIKCLTYELDKKRALLGYYAMCSGNF